MNSNTFIFSFVRMNPPTPGHLTLIKSMIYKAIELNVPETYIITSSSFDGKNPLPCSSHTIPSAKNKADKMIFETILQSTIAFKSEILEKMIEKYKQELIDNEDNFEIKQKIENTRINVICSIGSPFGFITNIIDHNFLQKGETKVNMFFIVGRDRADFLDTVVDTFITKDFVSSIDGLVLEREGMEALKTTGLGNRTVSEIDPSEYSASFVRGLVKSDNMNAFNEVYNKYLNPEDITKLFNTISQGLKLKAPSSKGDNENPRSKYYDDHLLPIRQGTKGGKRKRTNKSNKRKGKSRRRHTKKRFSRRYNLT